MCLNLIKHLDDEIEILEREIFNYVYQKHKREMEILTSVPGIGEIGAATLIAEIGDFSDFSSGDKLASWLGLVPSVYQSADKYHNGRITKRGSKVARWILTQIAQAAARKKNSKLKEFFNRKKKSIGHAKAIIAWQGKLSTIIWHLITNDEMYEDETGYEKGEVKKRKIVETEIFSVDERITIISGKIAIMEKRKEIALKENCKIITVLSCQMMRCMKMKQDMKREKLKRERLLRLRYSQLMSGSQ